MKQLSDRDAKRLALTWSELHGRELLAEDAAMRQQGVDYLLPRAEETVKALADQGTGASKRRNRGPAMFLTAAAAAAACLVLVAVLVGVPSLNDTPLSTDSAEYAPDAPQLQESAPLEREPDLIPLTFALPSDFRMASSDWDNGVTLYTLESQNHGDVVVAMYHIGDEEAAAAGVAGSIVASSPTGAAALVDKVIIDGVEVPARIDDAFVLIEFQHNDINFTLSSRDNLGALAAIYRKIVAG